MRMTDLPPWLRYAIVLTGLALIVYEAAFKDQPRFWLLVVYTAMIGLPSLFGIDAAAEARRRLPPGTTPAEPAPLPPPPPPPPPVADEPRRPRKGKRPTTAEDGA